MRQKGDRVGAILGAEEKDGKKIVQLLGYGIYDGDEVPPPGGGWMQDALHEQGVPNPKIVLDNGKVVWGCQCWWGSEGAIQKKIEDYKSAEYAIVEVDMEEELAKLKREASGNN